MLSVADFSCKPTKGEYIGFDQVGSSEIVYCLLYSLILQAWRFNTHTSTTLKSEGLQKPTRSRRSFRHSSLEQLYLQFSSYRLDFLDCQYPFEALHPICWTRCIYPSISRFCSACSCSLLLHSHSTSATYLSTRTVSLHKSLENG